MSGWTGSQQQSNNIQCKSESRAFSQEESRWKVRLDFPTALTAPRPRAQGETLPTYRAVLSVGVRGGDSNGAGRGRAPHAHQLRGMLWRECKGSFLSLWPLLPPRPPLYVYGPTALSQFGGLKHDKHVNLSLSLDRAKWPGSFFIMIFCIVAEAQITLAVHNQMSWPFRHWRELALWMSYAHRAKALRHGTGTFSSSAFYLSNCSSPTCNISDCLRDSDVRHWLVSTKDGAGPKQRHWRWGHGDLAKPLHMALTNMKQVFLDPKYFLFKVECKVCTGKISHCSGLRTNPCDFQIPQVKCRLQLHLTAQTCQLCNTLNYFKTIFSHPRSLLWILLKDTNVTSNARGQSFKRKYKWKMKYIQILWYTSKGMTNCIENALPPSLLKWTTEFHCNDTTCKWKKKEKRKKRGTPHSPLNASTDDYHLACSGSSSIQATHFSGNAKLWRQNEKNSLNPAIFKHGLLFSSTKPLKPTVFNILFNYWPFKLYFLPANLLALLQMGRPNREVNLYQSNGRWLSALVNHEPSLCQSQPSALQAVTKDPDLLC